MKTLFITILVGLISTQFATAHEGQSTLEERVTALELALENMGHYQVPPCYFRKSGDWAVLYREMEAISSKNAAKDLETLVTEGLCTYTPRHKCKVVSGINKDNNALFAHINLDDGSEYFSIRHTFKYGEKDVPVSEQELADITSRYETLKSEYVEKGVCLP